MTKDLDLLKIQVDDIILPWIADGFLCLNPSPFMGTTLKKKIKGTYRHTEMQVLADFYYGKEILSSGAYLEGVTESFISLWDHAHYVLTLDRPLEKLKKKLF